MKNPGVDAAVKSTSEYQSLIPGHYIVAHNLPVPGIQYPLLVSWDTKHAYGMDIISINIKKKKKENLPASNIKTKLRATSSSICGFPARGLGGDGYLDHANLFYRDLIDNRRAHPSSHHLASTATHCTWEHMTSQFCMLYPRLKQKRKTKANQ